MQLHLPDSWKNILHKHIEKRSFHECIQFLDVEYKNNAIYPLKKNIFKAFELTSFEDISVVIIGQDPYHQPGQAQGLSFSVPKGISIPPSLRNIYKEIESDLGINKDFNNGDLTSWADQGLLLLNSVLTVRASEAGSHTNQGWEEFTDYVIEKISKEKESVVFLLWGKYAQKKGAVIDQSKHLVLETSHPSPLGSYRGFIGCRHFSQTNEYLKSNKKKEIKW
jgi:uracil-DNA glycosylase